MTVKYIYHVPFTVYQLPITKEGIMKVRIEDTCTACGLCVDTCPEVFQMGTDMAEVKAKDVPPELQDTVRQAADECPVSAIVVG